MDFLCFFDNTKEHWNFKDINKLASLMYKLALALNESDQKKKKSWSNNVLSNWNCFMKTKDSMTADNTYTLWNQ